MASSIRQPNRDFGIDVALGRVRDTNNRPWLNTGKFGANPNVTTTPAGLWFNGGPFNFPTSPQRVRVRAGGNVNDTAAGSGARTLEIIGINSNLKISSEILTLAGASASAYSEQTWWRVYRSRVFTTGTYGGVNAGNIIVENETDAVILNNIGAGKSRSQFGSITTPDDYTASIEHVILGVQGTREVTFNLFSREGITTVSGDMRPIELRRDFNRVPAGLHDIDLPAPLIFPPLTDIFFLVNTATGNSEASGSMSVTFIPT